MEHTHSSDGMLRMMRDGSAALRKPAKSSGIADFSGGTSKWKQHGQRPSSGYRCLAVVVDSTPCSDTAAAAMLPEMQECAATVLRAVGVRMRLPRSTGGAKPQRALQKPFSYADHTK